MTASFDDVMLEFETIFEAASHAQSLKARRSLLAQATATLVKIDHVQFLLNEFCRRRGFKNITG